MIVVWSAALIAAAVALLIGVIRPHRRPPQEGKLTRACQKIILVAVEKYTERTGGTAPANPPATEGGATYEDIGVDRPNRLTDEQWEVYARSALLYRALAAQPECVSIIDQLPRGMVLRSQQDQSAVFVDAYGNCMDYLEDGANGGPALISGGPDGLIGGDQAGDDIRSDR